MHEKSILLVDDEEIILYSMGRDLRQGNYDVTLATSGEEAIRLLKGRSFDLVVTDLSMVGMDGIQVLKEAKKINSLTGVIIITGFGDMSSAIDALRLGADDYLLKPCGSDELAIRIERCLEKQKLAEQVVKQNARLAQSELQKTLLLNSAGQGIYGLDTHGRTTFINHAAEKMLGYTAAEIIGKNSHSLIHHTRSDGSPYPEEECRMVGAISKNEEIYDVEELLWRRDGTNFPVEYSSTPIRHKNEVIGAVVLFADLTEKKKQEERQRQVEAHLQQLQKFQSLNSMAAGIAHNFNNILTAVIGNQELALESMPADQKERGYIEASFLASHRAAKLSTMMLQFVGQGRVEMQQVEVAELIHEMIEILKPQLQPQVELGCDSCEEVFLEGDMVMIRQVLANLVTNAAESIGDEIGVIRLEYGQRLYSAEELQQPHMQGEPPAGEYVYLKVTDSGPGMDKEVLTRAFDPFFTTKFLGRGMGLAIVIGIMKTHRGTVLLESEAKGGVTATVLFPVQIPEVVFTDQTPKAAPAEDKYTGTVLLVDDEPILRDLGQAVLCQLGFEVLQAADGLEALDIFEKNMGVIDLVLLDIAMPRLNGVETLHKIREMSNVPVIISTGYIVEQVADQFDNITNVSFMQKPFGPKELKSKIEEMLHLDYLIN